MTTTLIHLAAALRAQPAVFGEVPDRLGRCTPPAAVEALPGARGESRVAGDEGPVSLSFEGTAGAPDVGTAQS